jgi:hypothetical protein
MYSMELTIDSLCFEGRNAMEWNAMECNAMEWNAMELLPYGIVGFFLTN